MDQDRVENILNELLPIIKPEEVIKIVYDVHHTSPNEYTLYAVFVVPDEWWDDMDYINKAAFEHHTKVGLKNKIKSYTGLNILFDKANTRVVGKNIWEG